MNLPSKIIGILHVYALNVIERILSRPLLARDHILRAYSSDGLTWYKDLSFRFAYPAFRSQFMNYFVTRDDEGDVLFRSSVCDPGSGEWHADLFCNRTRVDLGLKAEKLFYSPSFSSNRLFVLSDAKDGPRYVEIFRKKEKLKYEYEQRANFEGIQRFKYVEDVFVLYLQDRGVWRAWLSCGLSPKDIAIYSWISEDGVHWKEAGQPVRSPFENHWYSIANNPCVIRSEGDWKLYFRSGQNPAVGNQIFSATSKDLESWHVDDGVRIEGGGVWDSDGVGFPFAYYCETSACWIMYYTGYWGCTERSRQVRAQWEEFSARLKSDSSFSA